MQRHRSLSTARRRATVGWTTSDPWTRVRVGVGLLGLVLVVGSLGYTALGLSPLDAVYQTVITVSTVGYREIGEVDGRYKVFTSLLIIFGTGTALYTLGVLVETLFEGRLDDQFRRRRMQRQIERLTGHVVLCGYGQVGRSIARELRRAGRDVVVIDRDVDVDAEIDPDLLLIVGEATDDEVLAAAGLERASTLVLALDSDADNLYVTLTARTERPDLFIVVRTNDPHAEGKLRRAGADRVVNPHEIGGARMAALVVQPDVAEFLDVVMRDRALEVRLAEIPVGLGSPFAERTIAECACRERSGATLLAVRRSGEFVTNPDASFRIRAGDVLIALGTADQLARLREIVRA